MFLPKLMTQWLHSLDKPKSEFDVVASKIRKMLLPLMSSSVCYQLDDETVRLCQSVGPKSSKNGKELIRRWKPPAAVFWFEFDLDVAVDVLENMGWEFDYPEIDPRVAIARTKNVGGYLIDARYEDGVSIWLMRDRGTYIADPYIEMFFQYDDDGFLITDNVTIIDNGISANVSIINNEPVLGDPKWKKIDYKTAQNEFEAAQIGLDIPIIFTAIANSKNPIFTSKIKSHFTSNEKVKKLSRKVQGISSLTVPKQRVVNLSDIGMTHNRALDEETYSDESLPNRIKRKSPRRHLVRGHTFIRNDTIGWRNPHPRGVPSNIPARVVNDVEGQDLPKNIGLDDFEP